MANGDINRWLDQNKEGEQSGAVLFVSGSIEHALMVAGDFFHDQPFTPADVIAIAQLLEARHMYLTEKSEAIEREYQRKETKKKRSKK